MTAFYQSTTAHCEADALAHIKRDNPTAESIERVTVEAMGFGNLTLYRFEVTLPERRIFEVEDDTPMFFAKPIIVRSKTATGWA